MDGGFAYRQSVTELISTHLGELFGNNVEIVPWGIEHMYKRKNDDKDKLSDQATKFLRIIDNNYNNPTSMLLEYLPDYIVFTGNRIFFLEIKASLTPCWSRRRISDAQERNPNVNASNCGEIAREPFLAYKRYFPETVILYGTNYHRHVLLAQFAKDIQCLRCEGGTSGRFDCANCPLSSGAFFDTPHRNRNGGSGTPNTNINLDSFLPAEEFFANAFHLALHAGTIQTIKADILGEKIGFSGCNEEKRKKEIIREIWESGQHSIRCPKCANGKMIQRSTERGTFLGCDHYREHEDDKFTVSLPNA